MWLQPLKRAPNLNSQMAEKPGNQPIPSTGVDPLFTEYSRILTEAGIKGRPITIDRSFVASEHAKTERVYYEHFPVNQERSSRLFTVMTFLRGSEGPPGMVHGGAITAILDTAVGTAAWLHGFRAVSATLNTSFVKGIPLDTTIIGDTIIEQKAGRKINLICRLTSGENLKAAALAAAGGESDELLALDSHGTPTRDGVGLGWSNWLSTPAGATVYAHATQVMVSVDLEKIRSSVGGAK